MNEQRILIVEDEVDIASLLKLNLEAEGYKAVHVNNGDKAIQILKEQKFHLALMDIMLPGIDGLTVTESIKLTHPQIPVIFLTARGTSQDKITGLKKGGADYITKPFNLEELLLSVKNILARTQEGETAKSIISRFEFGSNKVNFDSYEAEGTKGVFTLTKKEALLLKLLIENENQVVSREKILQTVWGYSVYPSTRTIDNFILSFRKYFEENPKKPSFFHSMRGVGYKFTA